MTIEVYVTFQFSALHRWPDARGTTHFLSHPHRHIFKCKAWYRVGHADRQLEFFALQAAANRAVETLREFASTWSCEQWATQLLAALGAHRVEVSEDGENGAGVTDDE